MEMKEITLDRPTFDQWQSIGLVEGLSSDVEIAKFLIQTYDINKERVQSAQTCQHCLGPVTLLCQACHTATSHPETGQSLSTHRLSRSAASQSHPTSQENSQSVEETSQSGSAQLETSQSDMRQLETIQSGSSQLETNQSHTNQSQSEVGSLQTSQLQSGKGQSQTLPTEPVLCKEEHCSTSEPSSQSHSDERVSPTLTLPVKEENIDDDDDNDGAETLPCTAVEFPMLESSSVQQENSSGGHLSPSKASAASSSHSEALSTPIQKEGPSGQKKVWGAAEKKALTWFLDKYDVQSATGWKDCAVILNAALGTSTTGEDCRKQAMKGNLLTPKSTRRTRSSDVSTTNEEPQGSSTTPSNNCRVRKIRAVPVSRRPGLRSSSRSKLMQVIPDHTDLSAVTLTQQLSPSNCDTETKEDADLQDAVAALNMQFPDSSVKDSVNMSNTGTDDDAYKASQNDGELSGNSRYVRNAVKDNSSDQNSVTDMYTTKNSGSKLTWHYLGVGDVDLPDVTQKRKSFKHSPNDRYKCKECSSFFTHRGILVKHIRLAHLKWRPHLCPHCPAAYATKTKLQRHINVAHTKVRPFCCETCGASFVDHYTLICHKDTHKEDRQYRFFCELCGKGYYGMRELKRHMETHASRPTKSLLCWVCGKAVRTTQYLRIHLRTHSPDKAFTCTECHHVFTSKCALEKHKTSLACRKRLDKKSTELDSCEDEIKKKRTVSLLRKRRERRQGNFQCDICHKYFSAKKNIYKHKQSIHGVEAKREIDNRIVVTDPEEMARYLSPKKRDMASLKFSCDICSKRYSSQESMRKHKNIVHYGRRDYKCDLCEKTFTRHTSVIEHKQNVHNPAGKAARQTAQCDICQKTFAAKNSLRKHLKTVHFGLLPYSCSACGKKFASKYHLREHHKTSGHAESGEGEETASQPVKDSNGFHHSASPAIQVSQTPETSTPVPTPVSLASSCLPGLGAIGSWVPPSTAVVTPVHLVPGMNAQGQAVSAEASTAVRGLQSVSLWNFG